jgi:hypothetical protein
MPSSVSRNRTFRNLLIVGLVASTGLLALAASASAASLTVSASPSQVTLGKKVKLTVKGVADLRGRVTMFTQPKSPRCAANPRSENNRASSGLRLNNTISAGAFSFAPKVTTGVLGQRRACAYLDTGPFTTPVAVATTTYKVVLPLCRHGQTRHCRRH